MFRSDWLWLDGADPQEMALLLHLEFSFLSPILSLEPILPRPAQAPLPGALLGTYRQLCGWETQAHTSPTGPSHCCVLRA